MNSRNREGKKHRLSASVPIGGEMIGRGADQLMLVTTREPMPETLGDDRPLEKIENTKKTEFLFLSILRDFSIDCNLTSPCVSHKSLSIPSRLGKFLNSSLRSNI